MIGVESSGETQVEGRPRATGPVHRRARWRHWWAARQSIVTEDGWTEGVVLVTAGQGWADPRLGAGAGVARPQSQPALPATALPDDHIHPAGRRGGLGHRAHEGHPLDRRPSRKLRGCRRGIRASAPGIAARSDLERRAGRRPPGSPRGGFGGCQRLHGQAAGAEVAESLQTGHTGVAAASLVVGAGTDGTAAVEGSPRWWTRWVAARGGVAGRGSPPPRPGRRRDEHGGAGRA